MNGKTTILLSGLVAVLMVTCAVPFMASEDSDALTWNSNLNLNVTSAVLYIDSSSPDHSFTFNVVDAPAGTQASAIQWYFVDLEDGLNIASFSDSVAQTTQNGGFSATVYAKSIATGKTASSIEVVAYIDSTHYASAVVVVYPSESTTTSIFHFFIQIDPDAYNDVVIGGLVQDDPYTEVIPADMDIQDFFDGFWISVDREDTNIAAADFNAASALAWYISHENWYGSLSAYGWITQLFNLKTYEGDEVWNGDEYIGMYYYYWAQYHLTNNGWAFNNTTLGFTTTVDEMYIGLIFWASPPTMDVPEDCPGYPL